MDRAARTVALSIRGVPQRPCKVGLGLRHWNDIRSGDSVRATIKGTLTVYVPTAGEDGSPAAGVPNRSPDARVQVVDPSYRLLTVQYPNGGTQTFKLALHARIKGIEAGDSVAIRPIEVIKLRAR